MATRPYPDGVISWEDPPPPGGDGTADHRPWAIVAAELRSRPGIWALIDNRSGNISLTTRINQGRSWWKPAGSFEAVSRFVDGRLHIYARYVGPPR
jgi:hypothetical protein